jgi:hypothetical protein
MSDHIHMAQFWLSALNNGTMAYDDAILKIRRYLKAAGLTLADIGATEATLEAGRMRGCKMLAQMCLQKLRHGTIMYKTYLRSLRFYLNEGKLSFADISTTAFEVSSFASVDDAEFKARLSRRPLPGMYYGV